MGIMSSIGNIVSGVVGGGSAGRELGRLRGLRDSLIEKAAVSQQEADEFYAIKKTQAKAAANEIMQSKKEKQDYRDRGAAFLMREPIQNIIANINSMTNGQIAIDAEDPNLQAQLGQRLVADAQNGIANPEQSLTLSFRTDVYRAAKAGKDIFANIYQKKVAPQPGEQTPADRQTQSLGLGTAISKATGLGVTGALRRKKKEIMDSIPKNVQARIEARERGEPIDEPFKPILTSRIASDVTGQRRVLDRVLVQIANADPNYKYAKATVPGGIGSLVETDKSPEVGVISEANGLRALADSVISGGIYDENRPDQVYQDIKVLSRVAIESSKGIEDGTPQDKYNQAAQALIDKLMAMKDVEKIEYIEKQKALMRDGKIEVLTVTSMSGKVTPDVAFKSSLSKKGVDISTDEKLKEFIEEAKQDPNNPKQFTYDVRTEDRNIVRYFFEYNPRTKTIEKFEVYQFNPKDPDLRKGNVRIPKSAENITQEENKSLQPTNQSSNEPSVVIKQLEDRDAFKKLLQGN